MRTFDRDASGVVVEFGPSSASRVSSSRVSVAALPARPSAYGRRDSDPAVMLAFVVLVVASTVLAAVVAVALVLVA